MNINVQVSPKGRKLAILGRLDQAGEQQDLLIQLRNVLEEAPESAVEINFYDADTLPRKITEVIAELLDRRPGLKVVTYHALLGHALLRLGLNILQAPNQTSRKPALTPCKALALAGSAQSLDKIIHIVGSLPQSETVVFVAQHIQENQTNLLDQLLKVHTNYQVVMPQHLMPVEAGTIYVAPPGHHMKVAHGLVYLTRDRKIEYARPSIDVLFGSVAGEYADRAMAALLCGYGRDGVSGCGALAAAGACVLIEDGDDCEPARALPDNARDAGPDQPILKYPAIASIAAAAVTGAYAEPKGNLLTLFIEALKSQYGYDFHGYEKNSLERRIRNLTAEFGLGGFAEFQRAVLADSAVFQRLLAELSVSVTGFFRHPEQFRRLREEIVPYLTSFPLIKIWSAGCSTGEEAYSLAILLDELGLLEKSRIFATDINRYSLEMAKAGLFPKDSLGQSLDNYRNSGGIGAFDEKVRVGTHFLKADSRLCEHIMFFHHSLSQDGVFNEFQLIMCRNVLIYFDKNLQKQTLQGFARSLHHDGFLVLGPQDGLQHLATVQGFKPHGSGGHIYRRRGETGHV